MPSVAPTNRPTATPILADIDINLAKAQTLLQEQPTLESVERARGLVAPISTADASSMQQARMAKDLLKQADALSKKLAQPEADSGREMVSVSEAPASTPPAKIETPELVQTERDRAAESVPTGARG